MMRTATRTLILLAYGLVALGTVSACASEDVQAPFNANLSAKPDAGTKTPGENCAAYCPHPDNGAACCLMDGTCGVDPGTGCVPWKKDGG